MNCFEIKEEKFYINGKVEPLICGEIHYFRIPKENWSNVLDRLTESGCNTVAYYVPWFVHEYEEGKFDFHGEIHPDNDLHEWIRLTLEKGLFGILRPGPYVYAETTDLGIPRWFTERYPNAKVKKYENGEYKDFSKLNAVAHNHPDFISKVLEWYDAISGEIRQYTYPMGNIIMLQLCNEIPGDDYNDHNKETLGIGNKEGIYPSFLKSKYHNIERLNKIYGTKFIQFEEIEPYHLENAWQDQADRERLEFYFTEYYPQYFQKLYERMTNNGIHSYFIHNAYNPRAISLHYHNKRKNPWLNVGVDCYYSLSGQLNMKDATYYCEYGAEYSKSFLHNVPWVIEQECGYWHDYPMVYGPELYIWNIWTMASGYQGINMYLFASGINRPGMGFFGTDHNWQAPVNEKGEKNHTYDAIKQSIDEIKMNKKVFLAENRYDIGFGIKNEPGLIWKRIAKPTNEAYFALKSVGFTPKICDYEEATIEELSEYNTLFIVSDATMNQDVQEKLCNYIEAGGKLIINGIVPYQNRMGESCTVLVEQLQLKVESIEIANKEQEKIIFGDREYFVGKNIQAISAERSIIHALDTEDKPAALECQYGKGTALILPFTIEVLFQSTSEAIRLLLEKIDVQPSINGARLLRVIPKATGDAVVLNLHPVNVTEEVEINASAHKLNLAPYSFTIIND